MQNVSAILVTMLVLANPVATGRGGFRAVNLLPGYTATREQGLDVMNWKIEKPGGLIVHFEAGPSEGLAVNQRDRDKSRGTANNWSTGTGFW
jgi:hypothetical protein